ncbi:MAG: endo-1,3-1,4-beta glucanase-related protein [Cyclobacteriaceae bacterium]|nr:MAG: endo-1,3-1,4-beta glucanase-related protein [Cyclobacteriaceae bacterium]
MKTVSSILGCLTLTIFITINCTAQKPEETEVWEPEPEVVTPGTSAEQPPSDAIVLFDGTDLSQWVGKEGSPAAWKVENGAMTVVKGAGAIKTKQGFGSAQLHIEWRTPSEVVGESQGRGNSGIFLQDHYEVQVLDSYDNRTYSNGQAGSIYKQHMPLVNACRPPGAWQTYDIIYKAPEFDAQGNLVKPAFVTVIQNGVLVQNHVELKGPTQYIGQPKYEAHDDKLPLQLQDHGNPVSFRNIWIREL